MNHRQSRLTVSIIMLVVIGIFFQNCMRSEESIAREAGPPAHHAKK